ncbi:cytosolic leucyl tRNA synthetase, partial [Ceratobasidium sp. 414]
MVTATLRPETMYGQTNCFVGRDIICGLYMVKDDAVLVCTHRVIHDMAFQGVTSTRGEIKELAKIPTTLIRTKVHALLSVNPEVWVLPMEGVLSNKVCLHAGTWVESNIIHSREPASLPLPSDSSADAQTLLDLHKKPKFYGIDPAWTAFESITIISTPTYGDLTAPALLKACCKLSYSPQLFLLLLSLGHLQPPFVSWLGCAQWFTDLGMAVDSR